jgi:hypothetical protein
MTEARKKLLPWGPEKKLKWFLNQRVQRSYRDDLLVGLEALRDPSFSLERYGALSLDPDRFPLYAVRVGKPQPSKPNILITGGVHGYETSGAKGALLFLKEHALAYSEHFNLVVAPCLSPWAYETINRLNPVMENPNREFKGESKAEESRLFMEYLSRLQMTFDGHIDLHETTDSDRVFLPEEYSKNGVALDASEIDIPDGFYLIGTLGNERPELEKAMLDSVRKVTHLASAEEQQKILDTLLSSEGMMHAQILGICAQYTQAASRLGAYTTEMYPDSPKYKGMSQAEVEKLCCEAQIACIRGALDFWAQH